MLAPIRTPDQRLRVFVSSTLQELTDERAASRDAIQRLRLTPVMFEMSARAHPPRDLYRAYLAQSDVFIGIYWERYGWIAPSETISGLEDEYLLAREMPRLVYIKRSASRDERLNELIRRIEQEDRLSYRPFADAAELKELIENDLALMLTERFNAPVARSASDSAAEPALVAPPRSLAPVERGELIGRASLVEHIAGLLPRPDVGLITLTGPGGTGKTRLAIHLAHTLRASFADGVFYVTLAGVRDARDVVSTIFSTLEIAEPSGGGDRERLLLGFLHSRHALLVLDNFEQVLEAASEVRKLLDACPRLKVVATSREALHIRGERDVPVPPLSHPAHATLEMTPAMALFEERAREVRPDFRVDDDNRAAIFELCRRLDALPLAIELAAARVRVLSPQAMLPRLQKSLSLLSGAKRDVPERHQTLRATLDWSLDLLRPEERVFFRRLGVLAGSFTEDAAAAVADDAGIDVLEGLTSLVEKSLLLRFEDRGEARFQMLETVRELARERAAEAGEERAARLRHAEWMSRFLAGERARLQQIDARSAANARVAAEEIGASAALRFAASPDGDSELAWQLFINYGFVWLNNAHTADVLASYDLVKALPCSSDPVRAAQALAIWAWARSVMLDPSSVPDLEAACTALEGSSDRVILAGALTAWGMVVTTTDVPRALVLLERALTHARADDFAFIESWALTMICHAHLHVGALDEATRYADELARIGRRRNHEEAAAFAQTIGARVKLARGDLAGARTLFAKAVALSRAREQGWPRSMALCGLASATLATGDEVGARAILEEALLFCRSAGYVGLDCLYGALSLLLVNADEHERAHRVFGQVRDGAEHDEGFAASITDPSGALRMATGEARMLLGNPTTGVFAVEDVDSALRSALGSPSSSPTGT